MANRPTDRINPVLDRQPDTQAELGETYLQSSAAAVIAGLREELRSGMNWYEALLRAVAVWRLPEEHAHGRHYRYLIDGEAFDWLLLAERLLEEVCDQVPMSEVEALLLEGRGPADSGEDRFRSLIGGTKHHAHLNYVYGVTVEEALQLAVEEEIHKERRSDAWRGNTNVDDAVFDRLYHRPRWELIREFRAERSWPDQDSMVFQERKEFTYWLFKYRIRQHDPARVASDTRKGLAQLSRMELECRRRRQRHEQAGVDAEAFVESEVRRRA